MRKIVFVFLVAIVAVSCTTNEGSESDGFDRAAMLTNWADNLIIPAYTSYNTDLESLNAAKEAFKSEPTESTLLALRESWKEAYVSWQWVGMYQIGKAESNDLLGYTNTFPADVVLIEELVASGVYNFELPSRRSQQGFPALDYLINGLGADDAAILATYQGENAALYLQYMSDVVDRMLLLTGEVLDDWNNGYRLTFIANDGSSRSSAVDKLTNDFISYFEAKIRKSKVGDAAGVFTGTADATLVEAYYQNDFSKALFNASLDAAQGFFNGHYYNQSASGESLSSYLVYLNTIKETEALETLINEQFDLAREKAAVLSDSFAEQVESNNTAMLETYDELQRNVIYMKTDMLSAMNISVDYMDNDGD